MSTSVPDHYVNRMELRYDALEVVDVPRIVAECTDQWFNESLVRVNDSVMRIGIMQGEYHWHTHEHDDEFFLVLEGRFLVDLEDRTVELGAQQGLVVPRGVPHRPRAPERAVVLMAETVGIVPTGDPG